MNRRFTGISVLLCVSTLPGVGSLREHFGSLYTSLGSCIYDFQNSLFDFEVFPFLTTAPPVPVPNGYGRFLAPCSKLGG